MDRERKSFFRFERAKIRENGLLPLRHATRMITLSRRRRIDCRRHHKIHAHRYAAHTPMPDDVIIDDLGRPRTMIYPPPLSPVAAVRRHALTLFTRHAS